MPSTPDGAVVGLPPNMIGVAAAAVIGLVGIGLGVAQGSILLPIVAVGVALIMLPNTMGGEQRVRVTNSKLLVETARPFRGLLIGPGRQRVAWADLKSVSAEGDALKVESSKGDTLRVCAGLTSEELADLVDKVERRAADFKSMN